MSDLDDILDTPKPAPRPRGRPPRSDLVAQMNERARKAAEIQLPDRAMFYQPVGVKFLSDVFRMEQRTVLKKLYSAPIREYANERGRTVPKWDFVVASSYLVPANIDIASYLSSLNSNNVPPWLNKMFWDAQNARAKWEREAKETWHDDDVLRVLGETAIAIRETSLLWLEGLPGRAKMSNEDYNAMQAQVHHLLDEIKEKLIDAPKQRKTGSVIDRLPTLLQTEPGDTLEQVGATEEDMDDLLS